MKRFIGTVLCVSVVFTGIGGLVQKAGASFKSDEKALTLIRQAREAIGGDAAINNIRSLSINGKTVKTFEIEGTARTEQGDVEINLELPNKMSRQMKFGTEGAGPGQNVDVVVVRTGDSATFKVTGEAPADGARKIIVTTKDGQTGEVITEDIRPAVAGNASKTVVITKKDAATGEVLTEDIRPAGDKEKNATFIITKKDAATGEVITEDRKPFIVRTDDSGNIVKGEAVKVDGQRIFISKDKVAGMGDHRQNELFRTTLALLLSAPAGLDVTYTYGGEGSVDGNACDIVVATAAGSSVKLYLDKASHLPRMMAYQAHQPFVMKLSKADKDAPMVAAEKQVFVRELDAPQMAEYQVKFSDYRSIGGVQLPFRWAQTVNGKDDEITDITGYDLNPANIGEKFKEGPTMVIMKK